MFHAYSTEGWPKPAKDAQGKAKAPLVSGAHLFVASGITDACI
jgi:hypothetical protein